MFRGHPYARQVMDQDAASRPFGQVLPAGPPPGRPPSGDGSNATRLVDAMTGTPQPLTTEAAFDFILGKLAGPGNEDLAAAVVGLRDHALTRLEAQRQARRELLEKERAELRAACREKLDHVRALRVEFNRMASQIDVFGEHTSKHRAEVAAVRNDEPNPDTYPTVEELEQWGQRVRQAENVLREWEQRERAAENERHSVMLDLQRAVEAFQVAEQQETTLAARLAGRTFAGPFGIQHPPEDL